VLQKTTVHLHGLHVVGQFEKGHCEGIDVVLLEMLGHPDQGYHPKSSKSVDNGYK